MAAAVATHDFDADGEGEQQVSSFQSLAAEGDILAKQGDFRKAIEAYSKVRSLIIALHLHIKSMVGFKPTPDR